MKRVAKRWILPMVFSLILVMQIINPWIIAAASSTVSPNALYEKWERDGYPDDVGGVYSDSEAGMLGFLLVNPSPERMAELRAQVSGDIVITPCLYSYNELMEIHGEIAAELNPDGPIYGVGTGWTKTGSLVHGFGESGKEFRVVVMVDESDFERYRAEFKSRYSDKVFVEIGGPFVANNNNTESGDADYNPSTGR